MKRVLTPILSLLVMVMTCTAGLAAAWTVPAFNYKGWNQYATVNCVAYYAAKRKVYIGLLTQTPVRKGLLVYDTDANGMIIGEGRRYLSHPAEQPGGQNTYLRTILVDTRHDKLFLGIDPSDTTLSNPLVMYSLDANGEPTGTPQAFASPQPYKNIKAFALHPTLNRLYFVGWGCPAVYAYNLDTNGVPTGSALTFAVGGQGKYTMSIRNDGTKIYLGSYPKLLEVIDLDASGNKTGTHRSYTIDAVPAGYLYMSANNNGVYFISADNYLGYMAVTAAGEPTGTPVVTALPVQALQATSSGTVATSEAVTFTDAISGQTKTSGVSMKEYSLYANGALNTLLRETGSYDRYSVTHLNAAPDIGTVVNYNSAFIGNRFANLSMRAKLLWVEPVGDMTAAFSSATMSAQAVYLRFTYSARWNKVFTTDGSNINIYNLNTGALESNVACANASQTLMVDDQAGTYGKLYIALNNGNIDTRDLNASGTPSGTAAVTTTSMTKVGAIAINPTTNHVYLCGQTGTPGTISGTNFIRLPGSGYFNYAAVNTAKNRVYVCSSYNAQSNIWVWPLNADGTLNGATATTYADGLPQATTPLRGILTCLAVNSAKNLLYVVGHPETRNGPNQGMLIVYNLDANGNPTGTPRTYNVPNTGGSANALGLAPDGSRIYAAGWGDPHIYHFALDANGYPTGSATSFNVGSYGKYWDLTFTADGSRLLSGQYPSKLDIIAMYNNGSAQSAPTGSFAVNGQNINYGTLTPGVATGWTNLNTGLQNGVGTVMGTLTLGGGAIARAKVQFDFSLDGGTTILASRTADLRGNATALYLPRYDIDAAKLPVLASWLQTSGERHRGFLANLETDGRPQQYVVANSLYCGSEANAESVGAGLHTLAAAGHNTILVSGSGLNGDAIHNAALGNGFFRFKYAIYNPPTYFDYNTQYFVPGYQDNWAAGFKTNLATLGIKPEELALFHMGDEPGWYFPGVLNDVKNPSYPERIAVFRTYLQNQGLTPAFFGEASWNTVNPVGLSEATTLQKRRLLYWTARFYVESMSNAFAASTTALRSQLNANLLTTTNLNNWPGRFFIPSPNAQIANNPIVGPDSAMGMPDWFDLGRKQGVSCLWTEDWFADASAPAWSVYTDLLRCAAREGGIEYGAYVVGHSLGAVPDGGKYKVMALAGHGAKAYDAYTFGPNQVFADGWSDKARAYQPYADAFKFLGKAEKVLYPGRPRIAGSVAILLPKASQVWDGNSTFKQYMNEIYGLHYALTHAQYPVDFLDDYDIEEGKLTTYGYAVLYVSAPNLSATAQTAIANWVNAGGTVVMLPGACAYDEYNDASTILQSLMGASWGTVARATTAGLSYNSVRTTVTVTDVATLGAATDATPAQIAGLSLSGATSLATLPGGLSAVTRKTYGAGNIFAFGYWPGNTYSIVLDNLDQTKLPQDWRTDTRQILTAPCRVAGATKFVACTDPLVECALLESETAGIGITLLNWKGTPLTTTTLAINKLAMPTAIRNIVNAAITNSTLQVASLEQGTLAYTVNGNDIEVTLPLNTVDVLTLTW